MPVMSASSITRAVLRPHSSEIARQRAGHLAELREYQHALALGGDRFAQLGQALQLAALIRLEGALSGVLVGVVADLQSPQCR